MNNQVIFKAFDNALTNDTELNILKKQLQELQNKIHNREDELIKQVKTHLKITKITEFEELFYESRYGIH